MHNTSESFSQTVVTAPRAGRLYILPGKTFKGCSRWDHCFGTSFTTRGRDQIAKGIFFNQVLIKIFFSHENLHVKTSGIFVNQSINQKNQNHRLSFYQVEKIFKKWVLASLKSSCHDYSIKSSTDFAHYYLWLFSTLWRNTSHPFQNLQKIPTPPPTSPFSKCKCHVTFPYFYFHFKETACSSNFKEAQIPVDFSVPTKQVLTGVEHKLREKGRWLHWHSSPISPTAPARLLRFFL